MRVIEIERPGGPEVLRLAERPKPELGAGEVLVRVLAAGVNRPDVTQRIGQYPPPPGASDLPGLDIAGVVEAVADGVAWPRPGDPVCALVTGGGYAEYCKAPALQCLPLPKGFSFAEAAALPEVLFTTWNSMVWLGRLAEGESVVIQGGTSGVGLAAIQIAKQLYGATVFTTSGNAEKLAVCRSYGADHALSYKGEWDREILDLTRGEGVDLILDSQAGSYTDRQLRMLAFDGRLVLLATHQALESTINCRNIVRRRLTLAGATIRPRPPAYKGRIAEALRARVWPLLESGAMRIPIYRSFALTEAQDAHRVMDANQQIGKVMLLVDPAADNIP
jgi:NADPH2:quinone reductase